MHFYFVYAMITVEVGRARASRFQKPAEVEMSTGCGPTYAPKCGWQLNNRSYLFQTINDSHWNSNAARPINFEVYVSTSLSYFFKLIC
jgi:hypothetical protein